MSSRVGRTGQAITAEPEGVAPVEVLENTEEGAEIAIAFTLRDECDAFEVSGVIEWVEEWTCEDGRTTGRSVHVDADHAEIAHLRIWLVYDSLSGTNLLNDEIGLTWCHAGRRTAHDLEAVHSIEVSSGSLRDSG